VRLPPLRRVAPPGARKVVAYLWAAPISLAALPAALLGAATGGRIRLHRGVLEAHGGVLRPVLSRGIPGFAIGAIILGHVVLAAGADVLAESRAHERVHVRQYERWGALFLPLYLLSSLLALVRGGSVYEGNAFEIQACCESQKGTRP